MRRGMELSDQRINLAQVFPAPFLRLELSVANQHREITNLVLPFARQFLWSRRGGDGRCRFGEMNFEDRGIGT